MFIEFKLKFIEVIMKIKRFILRLNNFKNILKQLDMFKRFFIKQIFF